MNQIFQLLGFGVLAAARNMLGGFLITRSYRGREQNLKSLIALGAGFMLAAVFLEVVPEVSRMWNGQLLAPMWWLLGGYLLLQLAEHTITPHFHYGEEIHQDEMRRRGAAVTAVIALSIHTFFDGVAIASGLLESLSLGIILFLAIILHKVPEGFTVASIMLSSGKSLGAARWATLLIALSTFAGIITVAVFQPSIIYTLPFSAGVTLYVAASDLIPEVNFGFGHGRAHNSQEGHNHESSDKQSGEVHSGESGTRTSLFVFAGVALFYLTQLILHAAIGE